MFCHLQGIFYTVNKIYRAETMVSLLVGIAIFAILFSAFSHWQETQVSQTNYLYQQQALHILENQIALKQATQECEKQLQQNDVLFTIDCGASYIQVNFPLGNVRVNKQMAAQLSLE
ncbi:hypothetical protein A6046_03535 [[Haemophilus] ducreyi]|nr:hypothetical protein RY60_00685 [[Haemophilus] ducreyi]AKO31766.1 hypothetical protein RZ57_00690 [[Haemophilus] ducreyi]AKO33218.1 hypothetical protein RZ58_00690 [[Haemophilus] ducreyi]AKO34668.1 hypothetical protein RZ59_00685 [[Haemophilus] ducreyi]AKO39104.1 hypothetical protein RZ63_00660 [[Haemophilus] ducreyi]